MKTFKKHSIHFIFYQNKLNYDDLKTLVNKCPSIRQVRYNMEKLTMLQVQPANTLISLEFFDQSICCALLGSLISSKRTAKALRP